ncbi:MAG: hypothetical protein WC072_09315 [Methanoregulaceae archaeon]
MEKKYPKIIFKGSKVLGYCYAPKKLRGQIYYGDTDPRGAFLLEGKASIRNPREGESAVGLRRYAIRTKEQM